MHLNGVIEAAGRWSYAVVFVLTASETSAFIGLLVPGETAILLGGVLRPEPHHLGPLGR
jgi:membrane-associated protein